MGEGVDRPWHAECYNAYGHIDAGDEKTMTAIRRHAVVEQDGEVTLRGLPYKKGDALDVVLNRGRRSSRRPLRALDLAESSVAGMWQDYEPCADAPDLARELRERASRTGDRR